MNKIFAAMRFASPFIHISVYLVLGPGIFALVSMGMTCAFLLLVVGISAIKTEKIIAVPLLLGQDMVISLLVVAIVVVFAEVHKEMRRTNNIP